MNIELIFAVVGLNYRIETSLANGIFSAGETNNRIYNFLLLDTLTCVRKDQPQAIE